MKLNFKRMKALAIASLMFISILNPIKISAETGEEKVVTIYHTNDTHSRVDNFPMIKTLMNEDDADAVFLIDAGDSFHGQSIATLERGSSIAKIFKAMGYDAMTSGNHDYNYGYEHLLELVKESEVPLLAANVKKDGKLLFDETKIIEKNGVKIGFFGLATPETAVKTNPLNVKGIDFGTKETLVKAAQKAVDQLTAKDCDVIIGITHLGIDKDSKIKSYDIASEVKGIDLIIDGHSHSPLSAYEEFNQANETKITSDGEYANTVGKITIKLDKNNEVTSMDFENVALTETKADEEILRVITDIKEKQKPILDVVLTETPILLQGEREVVRFEHSNLGYLLCDAMINETGADIALTNGGGIRASIPVGEITKGSILTVLPFGNLVVTKSYTGATIKDALNFGLVIGGGRFTHFSGMDVTTETMMIDGAMTHVVKSIKIDGEDMDPNKEYLVATNDFMAIGGDGYTMLAGGKAGNEFGSLDEALINYISALSAEQIKAYDEVSHLTSAPTTWQKDAQGIWSYGKLTQWIPAGTNWYYVKDGIMQVNTWINDADRSYYVNEKGEMLRDTVIDDLQINAQGYAIK